MHIQESHQAQENKQAKCSTMTEDGHRKSGMNGIIDGGGGNVGAAFKQLAPRNDGDYRAPSHSTGGRLKFFKDGKFILELARAREGERMSWVSVPRKTFWPPQASTGTTPPTLRQESSTSLSVSDDNSSVQSSPWQRDHSWKQNTPRCNVSSEMTFFYHRPTRVQISVSYRKRRRPFDSSVVTEESSSEGRDVCDSSVQSIKVAVVADEPDGKASSYDIRTKSKANKRLTRENKKLIEIIRVLWEKKPPPNNLNAFKSVLLTNTRHEQMVSPRKRILRELERVTIDDLSNKRSRAKPTQSITFTPGTSGLSPSRAHNGTADTSAMKNTSSYSITSLLGHSKEDDIASPAAGNPHDLHNHNTQLSPNISQRVLMNNISPSPKSINYNHSPKMIPHHDSPDLSPSPEHYRYVSQQNVAHHSPTHALSPSPDVHKLYRVHGSPNHFSPLHGLVMHQKSPQYYTPSHRSATSPGSPRSPLDERTREHRYTEPPIPIVDKTDTVGHRLLELEHNLRPTYISPYMYAPATANYLNHPAYYGAGAYRNPYQVPYPGDPITHPPSPQQRSFVGHQPWSHLPPSHTLDTLREDLTSDVPLNLSKHAG